MKPDKTHPALSPALLIARISWIVPLLLLGLSIHQAKVVLDLARTAREGSPAVAVVTRYERADRKDVTHAELDLRIAMPDGSTLIREKLSLPYSIAHRVQKDTLHVRVLLGGGQEIVISSIVGTQRRIAMSNSAMSVIAMIIAFAGVFAWNRYQTKKDSTVPSDAEIA